MRRYNNPRKLTLWQRVDFQTYELRLGIVSFWASVLRKLDDGCGLVGYALSILLTLIANSVCFEMAMLTQFGDDCRSSSEKGGDYELEV